MELLIERQRNLIQIKQRKSSQLKASTSSIYFFNWGIVALQYCVNFCCTIKEVSYMHTCILSSCPSLPPPACIPPIQVTAEHQGELPTLSAGSQQICFTHGSLHTTISVSQFISHHLSHPPILKTLKYLTGISKPICQQSSHVYILTKLWLLFSPRSEVQMHYPALQFSSNALDNKRSLGSEYDKTRKHLHF